MLSYYKSWVNIIFIVIPIYIACVLYLRFGTIFPWHLSKIICPNGCKWSKELAADIFFSWQTFVSLFVSIFFSFIFSYAIFWVAEYFRGNIE